jgi:GNAT superfamily N-acetyltransferase
MRGANAGDAAGLAELLGGAGFPSTAATLARRIESLRASQGIILLALEWGPPSGVITVHWHPSLLSDQPAARIGVLLVGKDARRRGVGRLLLKAGAQAARSAGCGFIEIAADDPGLVAFCEQNGFAAAGQAWRRDLRKRQ